jgi:MFS family permease
MAAENYSIYRYRWAILAVYMFLAALTQMFWLNFTGIDTYIEKNLGISAMSTGYLAMIFPLVYLVLSLPAGMLIDRKGFKFGIGIGALFTGVFSLFRLVAPSSYPVLLVSQLGIAIGQPFVLNGITKLVVTWFPRKEEGTAVGLGSLALFIGMIVGLGLTPFWVESRGFNSMMLVYSLMGVLGSLLFFILARSQPPSPSREPEEAGISLRTGIRSVLHYRDFLMLGGVALIGIGVFNGLATWIEKILNELHNIPMVDAGTISAVLIFSGMLGCVIIPIISDRFQKRKPFLMLAPLVGAICMVILIFQDSFNGNLVNGIILGFFLLSALPIMLTMSIEITGEKLAGISVAYLQLLGNGAAVIIVPVMEILHGMNGQHAVSLCFLAILLVVGFLLATRIRETGKATDLVAELEKRDRITTKP